MGSSVSAHLLHDYHGSCWWCGKIADSREHRYKKSDVIRSFGKDWKDGVVRVRDGSERLDRIQGANSGKLKFAKVLCARCNNERSQKFDRAYDVFAEHLHEREDLIVAAGEVRLSEVFGLNWVDQESNLVKYFVKHACCRLAEDGVRIPEGIIDFLNDIRSDLPHLSMEMCINLSIRDAAKHQRDIHGIEFGGSLWSGSHEVRLNPAGTAIEAVNSHIGINCYFLSYSCEMQSGPGGFALDGDRLVMPRYRPEALANVDFRDVCQECNPQD